MDVVSTLIGDGGHAADIAKTVSFSRHFPHHSGFVDDGGVVVIGVNDPRLRARIASVLGVTDGAWVHPHTYTTLSKWGYGTHINYGVTMTRTVLGTHCTVSPGVTICGDVSIGDKVLIGAGATICDRVTIGGMATIGAGAVVLPGSIVPAGATWVGVPAR